MSDPHTVFGTTLNLPKLLDEMWERFAAQLRAADIEVREPRPEVYESRDELDRQVDTECSLVKNDC